MSDCPDCPWAARVRETEHRQRLIEDRQCKQDGYLMEVQATLREVQKNQVEAHMESSVRWERVEQVLAQVLEAVKK